MTFAFFNAYPGFGGLEIQMVKRASDAKDLGYSSFIFTLKGSKSEKLSKKQNLSIESISKYFRYMDFYAAYKISKILDKHGSDLCIVGKTESIALLALARIFCKKKFKILLYQQMQSGLMKKDFFHNWVYRNLDFAVVLTGIMKKELSETTAFPKEKIEVIPYGIELEKFNPKNYEKQKLRKKYGLPENSFILGSVGRIEENKGQLVLAEAFIKANIENSFLVICGNPDEESYLNRIFNRIKSKSLQGSFKYIPFSENVSELFACFDIFIMPSNSETFGLVLIEAMASELAAIGTNSGGVPEIIKHKKNGMLFEPKDEDGLADLLEFYYSNPDLRKANARQARDDALKKYDYLLQRNKFFELCEKLCKS